MRALGGRARPPSARLRPRPAGRIVLPSSRMKACSPGAMCIRWLSPAPASASATLRRPSSGMCGSVSPKTTRTLPGGVLFVRAGGPRVGVLPDLPVVESRRVAADRRLERADRAPLEDAMPADAEADRAELSLRDVALRVEPIQSRRAVRVELRDGRPRRVVLPAHAPRVVVRDHDPGRLDAVVDLGPATTNPVPPAAPSSANRSRELKDLRIEKDARIPPRRFGQTTTVRIGRSSTRSSISRVLICIGNPSGQGAYPPLPPGEGRGDGVAQNHPVDFSPW